MDIKVDKHSVICFDLDDTLYNELDYLKSSYMEIANYVSKDESTFLCAKMLSIYRSGENVFEYLKREYKCNIEMLLQMYRTHFPQIEVFNGTYEIFNSIKTKGGKLCMITDGRSVTQRNKLKALKVETTFDKIVISEEIGTQKPSENNFIAIEEAFPDHQYTYIGDNFKKDFVTPNKRNWNSIGILDNGKNIHNNAFTFFDEPFRPKDIVVHINKINII